LKTKLLLGTLNQGKIREYSLLLSSLPLTLVTPQDEELNLQVEEKGETMEENALLKARAYFSGAHLPTLVEDSGLEVEALDGGPGLFSARYGNSDEERISRILQGLKDIPWRKRKACFKCVIALVFPLREIEICRGECRGRIAFSPQGKAGFGYDPIFYLPGVGSTMAELTLEEKNVLSHRGKAARKAIPIIRKYIKDLSSCP
jgi:XTP/dITP diphosphohydrolase